MSRLSISIGSTICLERGAHVAHARVVGHARRVLGVQQQQAAGPVDGLADGGDLLQVELPQRVHEAHQLVAQVLGML